MIKEFKEFIMRGNVLDLAVAVIIGGAFGLVVTSFTNDVLMPPIGLALGGADFSNLAVELQPAQYNDAGEVAKEAVAIRYGQFINAIINFLIIGFSLFMVIKAYNKMNPPEEPAPAPEPGPTAEDLLTEIRDLLAKR